MNCVPKRVSAVSGGFQSRINFLNSTKSRPDFHNPSITTSAPSRHTSPRTCLEVFFLTRNLFSATKVRARIVRWNRRGSTSHLFDSNPRQDHDYLFKLPNALGRQDTHSISRS